MKIEDIEKLSKRMEKWHNKLYKIFAIAVMIVFFDVAGLGIWAWSNYKSTVLVLDMEPGLLMMYDLIFYVGAPLTIAFLAYTVLFTTFQFPLRFKGGGKGKKIGQPPNSS